MTPLKRLMATTALLSMLVGCTTFEQVVDPEGLPVSLTHVPGRKLRHFHEEARQFYLLGGLIALPGPRIQEVLAPQARDGRLSAVEITRQVGWVDAIFGILGLNSLLFSSVTVSYDGDVVQVRKGGEERAR